MRTTLTIDDDVLAAARELAETQKKTIGEVLSSLARAGLRPAVPSGATRNGILLLPVRPGAPVVTMELVKQLSEELL
jgi:hypothetical protein